MTSAVISSTDDRDNSDVPHEGILYWEDVDDYLCSLVLWVWIPPEIETEARTELLRQLNVQFAGQVALFLSQLPSQWIDGLTPEHEQRLQELREQVGDE